MEHLQNLEIEQQILGLTIQSKNYFDKIEDLTKAEHFSEPFHQKLFEKITEIRKTTNTDGFINVFLNQYFDEDERKEMINMIVKASTLANIRDYAFSLIDLYQKRKALEAMQDFHNTIIEKKHKYDFAVSELLDKIAKLDNENQDNAKISTPADTEKEIESETKEDLHLPTGFKNLDEVFDGGLKKKTLTVLGARPRVGKTSWCQQVILNIAKQGKVCLFASLEVSNREVYNKFVSINKSIPAWKITRNLLNQTEKKDYDISKQELRESNFIFYDDRPKSIRQIEAMVKQHIAKRKLDLLVVDYIQIIKRENHNKNINISEATAIKDITSSLKQIAIKYNIAVLGLAQLNRQGTDAPTMNDLKSSGGIEEDADRIIILHRQEDKNGILENNGTFNIAKNRLGASKVIDFSFTGEITTFFEWQ
jgi:replicative DNA helicase